MSSLQRQPGFLRQALPYFLVCVLVSLVVLQGAGRSELFYNTDEAQHGVTGLFFHDFLRDLPLREPADYTFRYYAQYPSLGLIHWPPFFHFAEGVAFLVLDPTPLTARLVVLLFALLGVVYWMRLIHEEQGLGTAVLSALLCFLLPAVLLFERVVMLEIPSLALCCAAAYYWWRFLGDINRRNLFEFAVLASLALLTKQQSLFLAPLCFLSLFATRRWKQMLSGRGVAAFLVAVLLVVPFYVFALMTHGRTIQHDVLGGQAVTDYILSNPLLFFGRALYRMLGIPLLVLAAAGMITARWWATRMFATYLVLWILSAVGTAMLFATREDRYVIYALPPLLFFAAGPLCIAYASLTVRRLAWALAVLLVAWQFRTAWINEQSYVAGFRPAAERLIATGDSGLVLFDGDLPGNFTFFARAKDPARRWIILRKALYVTRIQKQYAGKEIASTTEEIRAVLHRYGVKYVVVVQGRRQLFPVQGVLRAYLRTAEFRLLETFPVASNLPEWQNVHLEMFEYVNAQPRTETELHIPMLTLKHDIVVPIDKILNPR